MANILQISDGRKLHDRLLKKESVSPLEVIRNEYNHFSYNVVRRPEGQCLGNLRYFNLNYDSKTGHFFKKEFNLRHSSNFVITDYWKDRVRCFIVWNYGFGRYFRTMILWMLWCTIILYTVVDQFHIVQRFRRPRTGVLDSI